MNGSITGQYDIFQIDDNKTIDYAFMSIRELEAENRSVLPENYHHVYTGTAEEGETLDSVYEKFNLRHPADYRGHSLSVSDVITFQENGRTEAYYVDSFGFRNLPGMVFDPGIVKDGASGMRFPEIGGTWHTVDKLEHEGNIYFLMQSDQFGDSVGAIIVSAEDGACIQQDVVDGFGRSAVEAIRTYESAMSKETELGAAETNLDDRNDTQENKRSSVLIRLREYQEIVKKNMDRNHPVALAQEK